MRADHLSFFYPYLLNAFLLTVVLIICFRQMAAELRLVDVPGGRKRHEGAIPLCGGIAIFVAYLGTEISFPDVHLMPAGVTAGLAAMVLIGLADDRWPLPALPRLAAQSAAASLMIWGIGLGPLLLADPGPDLLSWHLAGPLAFAFSLLFIVGTTNAVNMIDGLDGLAGGTAAAALFWLALVADHVEQPGLMLHALIMLAAVLGFLVFNMRHPWRPRASVFLGDAGSLLLGASLACFILMLASSENGISFAALVWVAVVPLMDTLSLIARRLLARRSPLSPDRWHLHHLLIDAGVPAALATAMITAIAVLCGAFAYCAVLLRIPDTAMLLCLVPLAFGHAALVVLTGSSAMRPAGDQP